MGRKRAVYRGKLPNSVENEIINKMLEHKEKFVTDWLSAGNGFEYRKED